MTGAVIQAAQDGAAVVVGQTANRKIVGAVNGAFKTLPATVPVKIAVSVAAAVATTLAARQLMRGKFGGYSRFVAAGAFSEAINCALAQTPIAPYLGAYTRRPSRLGAIGPAGHRGMGAYVRGGAPGTGMGAYVQPRVPAATQT